MGLRKFKHAVTERVLTVSDDTRLARLVEADENYTEVETKSTSKKEAGDGSGNAGGRGDGARKATQRKRGSKSS